MKNFIKRTIGNISRMPHVAAVPFFMAGLYSGFRFPCYAAGHLYIKISALIIFMAGGFLCYFKELRFLRLHPEKDNSFNHNVTERHLAADYLTEPGSGRQVFRNCRLLGPGEFSICPEHTGRGTAVSSWSLSMILMFFLAFFMLGQCSAGAYCLYEDKNIFKITGESLIACDEVEVEGRIIDHPRYGFGGLYCVLEANRLSFKEGKKDVFTIDGIEDPIKIRIHGAQSGWFQRDDYIKVKGTVKNPGAEGKNSGESIESLTAGLPGSPLLFLNTDKYSAGIIKIPGTGRWIYKLRHRIYNCLSFAYRENLDWMAAPVAEALVLGNSNNVPQGLFEDFRKSGIIHLLAVSGLHISFFAAVIHYLLSGVFKWKNTAFLSILITTVFLSAYNLLLGGKASALRATISIILVLAARSWGRPCDSRILLSLSFVIILVVFPAFFHDRGFWLSFSAMSGIVLINPVLTETVAFIPFFKKRSRSFTLKTFFISISVQLMIFPQLLYYYGEASMAGVLSNIFIIPVFYVLLLVLLISSAVVLFYPPCGVRMITISDPFFKIFFKSAKYAASLDFFTFEDIPVTMNMVLAYYVILTVVILTARYLLDTRWQ
ncbi:MAG: ComEC/Rec2 family competence protein [Actinobacteria bacterium]|nr:ComEC/Rec2 family competence protein [Actinomycetota bacterium]